MRKKLFVCLMLMMCILAQAVPVGATGFDINSIPEPPVGSKLVTSTCLLETDSGYTLPTGTSSTVNLVYAGDQPYKIIIYNKDAGNFDIVTVYYEDGVEYFDYATVADFDTAVSKSHIFSCGDDFLVNCSNDNLVVFVDVDTSKPVFACSPERLCDFVLDRTHTDISDAELSIKEVDRLESDAGLVVNLVLEYKLPSGTKSGFHYEEVASYFNGDGLLEDIQCSGVSGEIPFKLENLHNGEYLFYLTTSAGNRYTASYTVDFADGTGTGFSDFTGSTDAPEIVIRGVPTETVSGPIEIELVSNMPVELKFDGSLITSGYTTSAKTVVGSNGVYVYEAVSEVGVVTTGSVDIQCLLEGTSMSGYDLEESVGQLVQTGASDGLFGSFAVIFLVVGLLLGFCGIIVYRRNKLRGSAK